MAYAILRIDKLHIKEVKLADEHARRLRETLNADPARTHLTIIGNPEADLEVLIRERVAKENARKQTPKKTPIRSNAVMATELVLSASPEYFRPLDPSEWGYWEPERLEDFQAKVLEWLHDRYGDRIVRAHLHLDEGTPHIHAFLVPLDAKGHLNCRELFGTRSLLSKLQDSFAKALKPLGLERGIKGSKATHTQIKKYYTAVNQSLDLQLDAQGVEHVLADRERILKENRELKRTVKALAHKLEKQELQEVQMEEMKHELELLEQQAKQESQQLKHEKEKFLILLKQAKHLKQDLPLSLTAFELGLTPVKDKQWLFYNQEHQVEVEIQDRQFLLSQDKFKVGNSTIELVMLINNCTYNQALAWLNHHFGEDATTQAVDYHAKTLEQQQKQAINEPQQEKQQLEIKRSRGLTR